MLKKVDVSKFKLDVVLENDGYGGADCPQFTLES